MARARAQEVGGEDVGGAGAERRGGQRAGAEQEAAVACSLLPARRNFLSPALGAEVKYLTRRTWFWTGT
jgi:hypothetical protein